MISDAFLQLTQDGRLLPPDCCDTNAGGTLGGLHVVFNEVAHTCQKLVFKHLQWEPLWPIHLTLLCSHLDGM